MINACQNYFETHQCALSIIINYFQKRCQNELNELENMGNRKLTDIIHQIRDQSPNDEVKIEDEFTLEEFFSHNITSIVSVCPNVFDLFSSESLFRILEHFSLNSTQNQSNITEFDDEHNEFHLDYNKLFSYFLNRYKKDESQHNLALFEFLDCSKMNVEYIYQLISFSEIHKIFIPNLSSCLGSNLKNYATRIEELERNQNDLKNEIKLMKEQLSELVNQKNKPNREDTEKKENSHVIMIQIGVSTDSQTNYFMVNPSSEIRSLKSKIHEETGIPVNQQILIDKYKTLNENLTLNDYGITNGTIIHMKVKRTS